MEHQKNGNTNKTIDNKIYNMWYTIVHTSRLHTTPIQLTTLQVQEDIKHSKINKSTPRTFLACLPHTTMHTCS